MLSAIAARKAAQAANQQAESQVNGNEVQPDTQRPSPIPMSPESGLEFSLPPTRKRQTLSDSCLKKRKKRKSRLTDTHIGRKRYFEASIEGFDEEDITRSVTPDNLAPTSGAYSPSQPIPDVEVVGEDDSSSGELSHIDTPGFISDFSPTRAVSSSSEDDDQHQLQVLSGMNVPSLAEYRVYNRPAFTPILDINTFHLHESDFASLQLPVEDGATLILLTPGHSLSFVGTASITLLQGAIAILGTSISPSLHRQHVFSPKSGPLASLEALDVKSHHEQASTSALNLNGRMLPQRVQNAVQASDNVVVIHRLHTGVEGLGKVCRTFHGVFDVNYDMREGVAEDVIGIEGFHPVNLHTRLHPQFEPFFMPETWERALDISVPPISASQVTPFVALVRGPKRCGKSTFARTLLNRLTTRYRHVAFLECDLGQSEFTPGGMVSLHVLSKPVFGPPFTHPTIPHRAHYVGNTTPRSNPSHYLASIQALVEMYRTDMQCVYQETTSDSNLYDGPNATGINDDRIQTFVPLIVNTQGWIKGLGGDLLRKIEELVQATDIFELELPANPMLRQRCRHTAARIHILQPILKSPLAAYYTAADHRSLSILSYFHCLFPPHGLQAEKWTTSLPLCARPPWEVDCRRGIDQIILVGAGYEDVVPQELHRAINCGVVALVCDEEDPARGYSELDPEHSANSLPYTQGSTVPSSTTSYCAGLGLIRGVDATNHVLHILTPLPPAVFSRCRILVKGELEMPVWGMLDFREGGTEGVAGHKWEKVPYLQMGGGGIGAIGAGRKRVRRNLMRRGQM